MMALFNKEKILEAYVEEERQEAAREAAGEAAKETAINLHNMGMEEDIIAQAVNVSVDLVRQWLGLVTA